MALHAKTPGLTCNDERQLSDSLRACAQVLKKFGAMNIPVWFEAGKYAQESSPIPFSAPLHSSCTGSCLLSRAGMRSIHEGHQIICRQHHALHARHVRNSFACISQDCFNNAPCMGLYSRS
jgi:hypothetical protein